jgi:transglutaminase-like putative cysteine protease
MQVASALTLVVLLTSFFLPIIQQTQGGIDFWNGLNNAWTNLLNGRISLQNPGSMLQSYQPPTDFFGNQLMITGSVHLPTGVVLTYNSNKGPQYLEGFTYNQFDGHTWTTSVDSQRPQMFAPNTSLLQDIQHPDYTNVTTDVTMLHPPEGVKHYIFAPAQPTQFDVSTIVYSDGTATAWTQANPFVLNEEYHVTSLVPPTDPTLYMGIPLPTANQEYWSSDPNNDLLTTSYLHVPSDLSSKEMQTLKNWTQGLTDTYSVLKAIETHLSDQNTFTYSVDNPSVPTNVDAVDWLLQTRKGYCTYYATAMSVMARQLGIPTRVVSGFSQGQYDTHSRTWVVRGNDAHSWVQAYLPGFGWMSFDPTPGFSTTLKGGTSTPPPTVTPSPTHPVATTTPMTKKTVTPPLPSSHGTGGTPAGGLMNSTMLLAFSLITLGLSLLFLLVALGSYWWRTLYANSTFVAGMYWRVCYLARLVGVAPKTWQTPYEYSQTLSTYAPQHARVLHALTHMFVRERWGTPQQAPHERELEAAQKHWPDFWRMTGQLLLHRLRRR